VGWGFDRHVCTQIRGARKETTQVKFTWALVLDEDEQARENRIALRNLRKISRKIAEQKREFEKKTGMLEKEIEVLIYIYIYYGEAN
jgi:hypothetical protein